MKQDAHLEIEVKFLVPDLDALRARLDADPKARCTKPRLHEYNIRYEDAANSLTPAGVVLRLRRTDRARLTYKAPAEQKHAGVQTRFEAEVDVDDFETMDLMLRRMGYHEAMIYEKYRTTYEVAGAEVVLDEMPFGSFVEVEGAPESIEAAVERLGLAGARRFTASYAELFEYVKANLDLTFRDLTFENFQGIAVSMGAFDAPEKG